MHPVGALRYVPLGLQTKYKLRTTFASWHQPFNSTHFIMATTCKQAIANFEGNRIRNKKSEKGPGAIGCTHARLLL